MTPDHLFTRPPDIPEQCEIPIGHVVPGRWQPRRTFNEQKLDELADSIREFGVLTRIKVFWNGSAYELIAGERRWRASQQAELTTIPAEVVEWTARQIMEVSIIDNLQRDDLSAEDEGAAFEAAIQQLEISEVELAQRMGKGRTYIQQRRKLASATPELRQALANGTITFSIARGILSAAGEYHEVQKIGTKIVLERRKAGHRLGENEAKYLTSTMTGKKFSQKLMNLGWNIAEKYSNEVQNYRLFIYNKSDKPAEWSGKKIYRVISEDIKPESVFREDERTRVKIDGEQQNLLHLFSMSNWEIWTFEPYLYIPEQGYFNQSEFDTLIQTLKGWKEQRQAEYSELGLELRAGHYDFSIYVNGVPSEHTAIDWTETGKILLQAQAGQIEIKPRYSPDLKDIGASKPIPEAKESKTQTYTVRCIGCEELTKSWTMYNWQGKWSKVCPACQRKDSDRKAAETKAIRKAIREEITSLLESATERQKLVLRVLAAHSTGEFRDLSTLPNGFALIICEDEGGRMRTGGKKRLMKEGLGL